MPAGVLTRPLTTEEAERILREIEALNDPEPDVPVDDFEPPNGDNGDDWNGDGADDGGLHVPVFVYIILAFTIPALAVEFWLYLTW